jgi:hypothetical protein
MTEQELSKMISEFLPYPAEGQHHALKQFAKLVAAAEREACAQICEKYYTYFGYQYMADDIRARGNDAA